MRSLILAGASALAFTAVSANAQAPAAKPATTTTAAAAATSDDEMILVTGSRIARSGLDSSVPVTSLTKTELMNSGNVNLGDTLNFLPAFRPTISTQNAGRFIGTAGINSLDLRGQGTARTLVLQNGRRHVTSSPGTSAVDVNTIPTGLIERVDVVTGGNSAIYGSDAVAGVVNFVLKRDFEGIAGNVQTGISSRGDRPTYSADLTVGKNFADNRGNIAASFEYAQQDPLYFYERDDFAGGFLGRTQFQLTQDTTISGPGRTPEPAAGDGIPDTTLLRGIKNAGISLGGAYTSACPAATATNAARRALNCTGTFTGTGAELGNIFVFDNNGNLVVNQGTQNFRPVGSGNFQGGQGSTLRESGLLQTGVTRYAGNLLGSFEFSPAFRVFAEGKFVHTDALQEGQPTFSSGALNPTLSINNPFLTDQARNLLVTSLAPGATGFAISRFNIDFGGRGENHKRDLYRGVLGVDGTFMDTWRYEASFSYGRVDTFYKTRGNVNLAKFTNAVNAQRNTAGNIVCAINNDAITTNDDPSCVPINLFGFGKPSAAALNYVGYESSREQWSDQFNAVAYISGDSAKLFELPGGPVAFVLGGEWRQERSYSAFDAFTISGGTFLNSINPFTPPTLTVKEAFGELRVPILKDVPFAKELTLEAAGRVTDYNVGNTGTVWTYNVGGIYSPVDDLRFRASFSRAIRAPTMQDLYGSLSQTFLNGLADPCGAQNINGNPNRVKNCAAAGVPTTQTFNGITEPFTNRPNSGISGNSGGNPNLSQETSDSWTVGGIFKPSFVPGLLLSVDYYNISLKDAINTIGAQTIINQCYDSPDGIDNQFCKAVFRNPNGTFRGQSDVVHAGNPVALTTTGPSFLQGPFNYAKQKTSGIDADLSYQTRFGTDWRFNSRLIVSYLINRDFYTSTTEPDRKTQQRYVLGDPKWNGQLRLNLGYKAVDFSWNMRYVGKQVVAGTWNTQFEEQGRPPTNADAFPILWYPDYLYNDIRVQVQATKQVQAYFGIDNLTDKLPPYDLTGTAGGDPFTSTGRFFYMGLSFKY